MTTIDEDLFVALRADDAFLIRRSFDRLWAKKQFATAFYDRLFELAPETQLLFHGDLRQQRSRLMTMVSAIVGMRDQPEMFRSTVASLTLRHASYGVQLRHYEPFQSGLVLEPGTESRPSVHACDRKARPDSLQHAPPDDREGVSGAGRPGSSGPGRQGRKPVLFSVSFNRACV